MALTRLSNRSIASVTALPFDLTSGMLPAGSVLQVVSATQSGFLTINTGGWQTIPGYSLNITPRSTSSKILINYSLGRATTAQYNMDHVAILRVMRNGSHSDLNGAAYGSRDRVCGAIMGMAYNADHNPGPWSFSGIDSPATTSQINYTLQTAIQSTSYPLVINGVPNNSDTGNTYHSASRGFFIAMEIAG